MLSPLAQVNAPFVGLLFTAFGKPFVNIRMRDDEKKKKKKKKNPKKTHTHNSSNNSKLSWKNCHGFPFKKVISTKSPVCISML